VNEQLGPAAAVQSTVVVPFGKNAPDAGLQMTVPQPGLAVGAKVAIAPHRFESLALLMLAGQVIVQGTNVTVNEHPALLLLLS
jgi:hypothetical protein